MIESGESVDAILDSFRPAETEFAERRRPSLLY